MSTSPVNLNASLDATSK
jgi:hypothetical protein